MILDAPILFETKVLEHICHPIIVVSIRDEALQRKRLMGRNKELSAEEAQNKIDSQMSMKVKEAKADIVIHNEGTAKQLGDAVVKTVPKILHELKLDKTS